MSLKKSDITKNISSKTFISGSASKELIDSFIDIIKSKSNEQDVKVANFGTFTNKVTPERIGRNPKTGEEHIITERVKLSFITSNKVKDQLN
jgi:integration host factor subunit alpha